MLDPERQARMLAALKKDLPRTPRRPWWLPAAWTASATLAMAAVGFLTVARDSWPTLRWPTDALAFAGVSLSSAVAVLFGFWPGRSTPRALGVVGAAAMSFALLSARPQGDVPPLWPLGFKCLVFELAVSAPLAALAFALTRGFTVRVSRAVCIFLGVNAAALALLHVDCHVPGALHLVVTHLAPALALAVFATWARRATPSKTFVP